MELTNLILTGTKADKNLITKILKEMPLNCITIFDTSPEKENKYFAVLERVEDVKNIEIIPRYQIDHVQLNTHHNPSVDDHGFENPENGFLIISSSDRIEIHACGNGSLIIHYK